MQRIDAGAIFPRRGGGLKKSGALNLISGDENNRVPIFFNIGFIPSWGGYQSNPFIYAGF